MHRNKTSGAWTAALPALLCAAVLSACGGGSAGSSNESVDGVAVDGELLVGVRAGTLGSDAIEALIAQQGQILHADEQKSFYRVALNPGVSRDQAAAALAPGVAHPDIVYVEPNYLAFGYAAPSDPFYATSQYSAKVQAELEAGWDAYGAVTPTGTVVIAVLDTGVRATHEDLAAKVDTTNWKDYVALANTTVVDDHGHGTQLASIAAAEINNAAGIAGVASWTGSGADPALVTIMPVKVADSRNVSNHAAIAAGMSWAVSHGADIILLSLGSATPSWTLQNAVQQAYAAGVLVVAAAGNDGVAAARYPAGYQAANQAVLSVSSANQADAIDIAHRTNFGSWVNVLAPGDNLTAAGHADDAAYVTSLSGSSYAAAHVAGMAALLWSAYVPSTAHGAGVLTVNEVRNAILAGVDSYDRSGANAIALSGGRVNLQKAFAAATNIQSHGATPTLPGSVVFNATSVRGGAAVVGTVVLTDPAPASTVVALSSNNAALVVPASVTVLRGYRSATFAVTTSPVAATTLVTVTATGGGVSATGQISLTTPGVSRVALSPSTVVGGTAVAGTVTLAGAAPVGGVDVTLSDNSDYVNFGTSTTVKVLAGQTTAKFTANTTAVTTQQRARITATASAGSAYADLTINPALAGVSFTPNSVKGGATSTLRISLNSAMPADISVAVSLTGDTSALTPESLVTTAVITKGQTSKSITVTTLPVAGTATISATATYAGVTTSAATLTVNIPGITSVTASTGALIWWDASHVGTGVGTVTLDAVVASTTTVYLSASDSILAVPSTVTVAPGARTAQFIATPAAAVSAVSVSVSASLTSNFAVKKSATFQLKPALQNFALSATQVVGGTTVTGTVTLSAAAPTGNFAVNLSSDSARATVDPTVSVTAGQTTRTFSVVTSADPATATVNVTASVNGVVKTLAIKLTAPGISSVTFSPTSASVGDSVTGTVTLGANALGRTAVTLVSNDTTAIPGLTPVYVATGATTGTFTFTAGNVTASKQVTVTATLNGVSKLGTITISPRGVVLTVGSASVNGGTAVTGTVTIPANAPVGGTPVTVAYSDPAVSGSTTVTVPAGSRTATFSVATAGVDADTLTTLSATAGGYTSRANVTVLAPSAFTLAPTADIVTATTTTFTITLNARAGPAGVTMTFTPAGTQQATLTPPASNKVPAGQTSVTFTLATISGDSGSLTVAGPAGVTGSYTVNYLVP